MKIVSLLLLLILLSCPGVLRAEKIETKKILEELDAVIARKDTYRARKEASIEDLKKRLERVDLPSEKLALSNALFYEYLHYQADSAMYYLNRMAALEPLPEYPDHEVEITINRAEVMGVMDTVRRLGRQGGGVVLSQLLTLDLPPQLTGALAELLTAL